MMNTDQMTEFSIQIEMLVKDAGVGYMEAIVEYSERNDVEIEVLSKLISPPLKAKLQYEAENLHMIKKSSTGRLPI